MSKSAVTKNQADVLKLMADGWELARSSHGLGNYEWVQKGVQAVEESQRMSARALRCHS